MESKEEKIEELTYTDSELTYTDSELQHEMLKELVWIRKALWILVRQNEPKKKSYAHGDIYPER